MKMKAVLIDHKGGPEVLRLAEVDAPTITGPHDVLVRVRAAGVNPADVQIRDNGMPAYIPEPTVGAFISGMEGAGVVEAVGAGAEEFSVGDEVYYYSGSRGGYAERVVVDGRYLARKPTSIDFLHAAGLPVVLLTAWEAMYDRVEVRSGDFVLVQGGAGGVGHIAVQLAALHGARVAATVSTEAKAEMARSLGAEKIIRYREEDVAAAVRAWSGKSGADVVLDTVGGATFAASFDLVADYGSLISVVVADWPRGNTFSAESRNLRILFENMGSPYVTGNHAMRLRQRRILEEGARLVDEGKLRVVVNHVYPLDSAAEAQRALGAAETSGRVVLDIARASLT